MTPLRILVCHYPGQQPIFTIREADTQVAISIAPLSLGSLDFVFRSYTDPDLADILPTCDAMVGWQVPRDIIRKNPGNLRLIQLTGAGVEHLAPLDWLPPHVALANASGIHAAKLEEWALMTLLMLHAHMPHFVSAQRAHHWSKRHSSAIAGKTVLIYGTGGLGQAVARAAGRLALRPVGVRRSPAAVAGFDLVVGPGDAASHLAMADFVIFTLPLTPDTRALGNADFFASMKKDAAFANFGRGGLVVETDLMDALASNALSGAVIDVTSPEPPAPESPLWDTPRLIITPHISCDDPATYVPDVLALLLENLALLLSGKAVRNRVDPARAY
jgi:phosphoglycerate dehydrogenase-like enzyme